MATIPLIQTPRQSFFATVGDQGIRMTVWWQPRDEQWYASIQFPAGTPLVSGRRLVLDGPIVGSMPSAFQGDVWCRGLSANAGEPGAEPWGTTHQLVYEP